MIGGDNRWLSPQPRDAWAPNVADALTFAAGCSQIHHNPDVPVRVLLINAVLVAQLFY